jgi:hypothetical protein
VGILIKAKNIFAIIQAIGFIPSGKVAPGNKPSCISSCVLKKEFYLFVTKENASPNQGGKNEREDK